MKKKILLSARIIGVLGFMYLLVLAAGFFGVKYGITNTLGAVDDKSDEFEALDASIRKEEFGSQSIEREEPDKELQRYFCEIEAIDDFAPVNAQKIRQDYYVSREKSITAKMIFAVKSRLSDNGSFQERVSKCAREDLSKTHLPIGKNLEGEKNVFPWMNTEEWETIKAAVTKDKGAIEKASRDAGVEPRLLVSNLIVEQVRLFHSQRELFQKFFEPLKILGNATKISLGVMGIKELTAMKIENNLRNSDSDHYLGRELENALDFVTADVSKERFSRLTDDKDRYYNYFYGALYIKQLLVQWEKSGHDIKYRPEIVGTLYNVGFAQSHPKPDPKVGGSSISVGDAKYSFGSLAYEFYYSGELLEEFPYVL